jgi:HD-GYP domain-containing protein (c-di-GMP phosphodiesterase class II)
MPTLIKSSHPTLRYKSSKKVRVPVSDLKLGMYVAELDRPWEGTPFLFQGFTIETEQELGVLAEYCDHVTIDIESSVDFQLHGARRGVAGVQSRTKSVSKRHASIEQAIGKAQKTHVASSRLIRDIMDDVRLGKSVDTPAAREAVTECVDNVIANQDAMTLLTRIREKDEYTSQHSLSVSILTVALGRHIGLQREELIDLGMCGLLHDVGKILIPDPVLLKPGKLSEQEMAVMREHATHGRDVLLSSSGAPLKAIDVAHAHHEHIDGGGYPRGLTEAQITPFTRMVAITDTFDAITSDRIYSNSRANIEAFRILSRGRNSHWDARLVVSFVEAIGIYPAGTPVELSNKMIGIVIETHPTLKLRPKIILTHSDNGPLNPPVVVNLANQMRDEYGRELQIGRVLRPSVATVSLRDLRDRGLLDNLASLPDFSQAFCQT